MAMLEHWLWLTTRMGLGARGVLKVLEHFETPERAFYGREEDYIIEGLTPQGRESLLDKSLEGVNRILGDCDRLGMQLVTIQDAIYPERLRQIADPPVVLYVRGKMPNFDQEAAIGVVGTRHPSSYGQKIAPKLGMELTRGGALLISGMAQGIDCLALQGALQGGEPVVSVVAGGIDVPYPVQHRFLYEDVAAVGAILSEYPPGTKHKGSHFPLRNRIISGLSLGVVAVECRRFSGTMLTMEHAMEQNRDIFAVPGAIDAPNSEGTNWLIQQGAKLITGTKDILEEYWAWFPQKLAPSAPLTPEAAKARLESLGEPAPARKKETKETKEAPLERKTDVDVIPHTEQKRRFTDDQILILHKLGEKKRPYTADELVEATQIPARRVLSALTMLQVDGAVAETTGRRFETLIQLE